MYFFPLANMLKLSKAMMLLIMERIQEAMVHLDTTHLIPILKALVHIEDKPNNNSFRIINQD